MLDVAGAIAVMMTTPTSCRMKRRSEKCPHWDGRKACWDRQELAVAKDAEA